MAKEEEKWLLSHFLFYFHNWKDLKNLELTSYEEHKKHTFDSYCKKTLKNEAINIQKQLQRQRQLEVSFSDLSELEYQKILAVDNYVLDEERFQILNYEITVKDENLIKSLCLLSNVKLKIILLSYFLDMTDNEIGEALKLARSTVQYRRKSALKELKKRLEENDNEPKSSNNYLPDK